MIHYKDYIYLSISRYGDTILKKNIHFPLIVMIMEYVQEPLNDETFKTAVDKYNKAEIINKYGPISYWDVSEVANMSKAFYYNQLFNEPLNLWNVSNVTDMSSMFSGAVSFNQPLASWDVSNVTCMKWMFSQAYSFNQPLASWNVSNVTYMKWMFYYTINFNQPLASWNVSKVTDMSSMFSGTHSSISH